MTVQVGSGVKRVFLSGCDIVVDGLLQDCLQSTEDNESVLQANLHQLQTINCHRAAAQTTNDVTLPVRSSSSCSSSSSKKLSLYSRSPCTRYIPPTATTLLLRPPTMPHYWYICLSTLVALL